jgi:hypothetical protein
MKQRKKKKEREKTKLTKKILVFCATVQHKGRRFQLIRGGKFGKTVGIPSISPWKCASLLVVQLPLVVHMAMKAYKFVGHYPLYLI